MSASLFALLMLAAFLHASWNALIKAASSAWFGTVLVAGLPACWPCAPCRSCRLLLASWPYIAASVALQVLYLWLIARSYRVADMGLVYPLMRGTAPLLVALCNAAVFGESLLAGYGRYRRAVRRYSEHGLLDAQRAAHGVLPALLNALVIAAYTLVDGVGVRLSAAPASYTLWIFLLCGLPLPLWAALRQPAAVRLAARLVAWPAGRVGTISLTVSPCGPCCRHRLPWWRRCGKPPSCSPCCWRGWCWANTPGGCACWPHW
jgi:multidrug transporter EmrE-like cation transporter